MNKIAVIGVSFTAGARRSALEHPPQLFRQRGIIRSASITFAVNGICKTFFYESVIVPVNSSYSMRRGHLSACAAAFKLCRFEQRIQREFR